MLGELQQAWIHEGEVRPAQLPRYGTTLLPIHVARAFGASGMVQTLPAACAAGNYAIGFAADQIRSGRCDVAVTGAYPTPGRYDGVVAPDVVIPTTPPRPGAAVRVTSGVTEPALR